MSISHEKLLPQTQVMVRHPTAKRKYGISKGEKKHKTEMETRSRTHPDGNFMARRSDRLAARRNYDTKVLSINKKSQQKSHQQQEEKKKEGLTGRGDLFLNNLQGNGFSHRPQKKPSSNMNWRKRKKFGTKNKRSMSYSQLFSPKTIWKKFGEEPKTVTSSPTFLQLPQHRD